MQFRCASGNANAATGKGKNWNAWIRREAEKGNAREKAGGKAALASQGHVQGRIPCLLSQKVTEKKTETGTEGEEQKLIIEASNGPCEKFLLNVSMNCQQF